MAAIDIALERLESPAFGPIEAFARLRSHTPGRGAFLLESLDPSHPAGRYSVLGYRVRSGEAILPQVDAASVSAAREREPRPETFAAAMALASVGAFSSCIASARHRVPLFEDEGPSATFDVGATVMLFDHADGSATVAGPAKGNLVPRLLYELEHGPSPEPIEASSEEPSDLVALPDHAKLAGRVRRAQSFLDDDELPEVVVAQSFSALVAGDPFDAYRRLRAAHHSATLAYFIDFGETPMSPSTQLFGLADEVIHLRRRDETDTASLEASLAAAMPHPRIYGPEPVAAMRLLRRLEEEGRQVWGGAVGYLCPGGESTFALADRLVTVIDGRATVTMGASVRSDTDAEAVSTLARAAAGPLLTSLRTS